MSAVETLVGSICMLSDLKDRKKVAAELAVAAVLLVLLLKNHQFLSGQMGRSNVGLVDPTKVSSALVITYVPHRCFNQCKNLKV